MHLPDPRGRGRRWLAAGASVAVAGAVLTTASASAQTAPASVSVTVNADEGLGTVPSTAYGLNQAVWDSNMNTQASVDLISQANVGMMRYPGGSYGDGYHWQTNTVTGGGYVAPGTDFDSFMNTVQASGSQAILIANYGTGTPQEAADWVRYANITKGYHDQYWEIGNEVYGNGYYGADWELDNHASKSPATYASNVVQYAKAMKAVDPTIKIGAVVTLPGNGWPDGVVASGDSGDWNQTVLPIVGSYIDFVIVHYYPAGPTSAADALQQVKRLPADLAQLRQEISQYAGPNAPNIGVAVTETEDTYQSDTQPGALFNADVYFTALENGAFTVDYWDTRNGMGTVSTAPDGATDYGDGGLLSSGGCNGDVCEPPLNTPFPAYYALQMLSKVAQPGDTLVKADSDNPLVSVHAARNANGDLSVELVNEDPDNAHPVNLNYDGWAPSTATPTVYAYGDEATSITTSQQGTAGTQVIPPYSIVTLKLTPSSTNPVDTTLTAPSSAAVTNISAHNATISWQPSTGGSVTRYEVYEQHGTNSVLLGESTSTSFTAQNLEPGASYTVNVLATDQKGYLSMPSQPVTFVTGTPQDSTCAITYDVSTGWGTGFVASISITDSGPNPITGWTLAFRFPASTESVSASTWNANYSEDGQNVVVTPVSWDANLAANSGNTASIGFVGNQTGANPPPASFTLNGTVCTTTYSS